MKQILASPHFLPSVVCVCVREREKQKFNLQVCLCQWPAKKTPAGGKNERLWELEGTFSVSLNSVSAILSTTDWMGSRKAQQILPVQEPGFSQWSSAKWV